MITFAQKMTAAAEATGLSFDTERSILHGTYRGYSFATVAAPSNARYCTVYFSIAKDWNHMTAAEAKDIAKQSNKLVEFLKPSNGIICSFLVKLGKDEAETAQKLTDALNYLVDTFSALGYGSVCERCHQSLPTDAGIVGNSIRFLCPNCFEEVTNEVTAKAQENEEITEHIAAGAVGAFGGALIGGVAVVLFSQLGFVSALSGVIAAVCALKGYELLAKKMSVRGAIIACAAMVVMIYLGDRVDWAIDVAQYFETDFFTAFRAIPMLISEGAITLGSYLGNLFMVYLFAALGAVPTVIKSLKSQKNRFTMQKLN